MNRSGYSVILWYRGKEIIVENGIYKLRYEMTQYLTMDAIKQHIEQLENFPDETINRVLGFRCDPPHTK